LIGFFVSVSFWPVFSSSVIRTGLSILNPGSAIFLSVVEALTVKTQILVPVARHFLDLVLSHSSVFSKGNVVVTFCESVKLFIHFLCCTWSGSGIP
jgi:hypothetical protein